MEKKIMSVAHRGFRFDVDENTFMAFDKSVEVGIEYIEFDVQLTADGIPVVFHDKELSRMTGKKGNLKDLTLQELKQLRTINHQQEIPTLEEVFLRYGNTIGFMIEIKDPEAVDSIISLIKSLGNKKGICISGRDIRAMNHAFSSLVYTCLCFNITNSKDYSVDDFMTAECKEDIPVPCEMISLSAQMMDEVFIEKCKQLGIKSCIWNLGPEKEASVLFKKWVPKGLDIVLFDDPSHFEKEIKRTEELLLF